MKIAELAADHINTRSTGEYYENIAFEFLQAKGLNPVARNFSRRQGEIDIIMQDEQTLVFVEVRYRSHSHFGSAIDTISHSKQQKLIKAAHYFLSLNPCFHHHDCRFDVIAIDKTPSGETRVDWIQNAFME